VNFKGTTQGTTDVTQNVTRTVYVARQAESTWAATLHLGHLYYYNVMPRAMVMAASPITELPMSMAPACLGCAPEWESRLHWSPERPFLKASVTRL